MRVFFRKLRHPIQTWRAVLTADEKLRVILGGMILALIAGIWAVTSASITITGKADEIKDQQNASLKAAEQKAASAEEASNKATKELREVREAVAENTKLNSQLWEAFKQSNPKSTLAIPQVVEPTPEPASGSKKSKPMVIVVPPAQTPAPIVKPTPEVKWRTRYVKPKTLWEKLTGTPKPTPKPKKR